MNSASSQALLWQDGTPTDLGNRGGTMNNIAFNTNNHAQVVGQSGLPGDTTSHAFLWQNGTMTDLGTLPGDVSSSARGINNEGQVVGFSTDASGNDRPFLWENGVMTDLNTLVPADSPLYLLVPFNINSHGAIVGCALELSTGEIHAFLATPVHGNARGPAARGETSQRPKTALPENVREQLQKWMRFGRPGIGVLRPR